MTAKFIAIGDMDAYPRSAQTRKRMEGWNEMSTMDTFTLDIYILSNIISIVPYMITPGNHDMFDNGKLFEFRWMMADNTEEYGINFYGVRRGPVYFFFANYDYFIKSDTHLIKYIIPFIEKRLVAARAYSRVKWIVLGTHRGSYCGQFETRKDCKLNFYYFKPIESLYSKYGVDIVLGGHEHFFEVLNVINSRFTMTDVPVMSEDC